MIITRHGTYPKYKYYDADNKIISDKNILEYIKSLNIPHAYHDIKIFYGSDKILYEARDKTNKLQQKYSSKHNEQQYKKKFKDLIEFGIVLPKIDKIINENFNKNTRLGIMSLIISLITRCGFRIGSAQFIDQNGTYGISNILKKHIKISNNMLEIKFIGKKNVENICIVKEKCIINRILQLIEGKKDNEYVFSHDGKIISGHEINTWLSNFNKNITTKYFRTFNANTAFINFMRLEHNSDNLPITYSESARKKISNNALEHASNYINNTRGICKSSYMLKELIDLYIEHPIKFKTLILDKKNTHSAFIDFLKYIKL